MPDFTLGGLGQTLKSGLMGDVNYNPETKKLDTAKADQEAQLGLQTRGDQSALGKTLRDQMAGKGPSVAQQQMLQGRDAMMRGVQAAAASGRGSNAALANQQGMTAGQNIALGTNRDSAMLRAGEMQQATGQYSNLLQAQRQGDTQARGISSDESKAQLDYYAKLQAAKMQGAIAEQKGAAAGVGAVASGVGSAIGMSDERAKTDLQAVGKPASIPGNMDQVLARPDSETDSKKKESSYSSLDFSKMGTEEGLQQGFTNLGSALGKAFRSSDPDAPAVGPDGMTDDQRDIVTSGLESKKLLPMPDPTRVRPEPARISPWNSSSQTLSKVATTPRKNPDGSPQTGGDVLKSLESYYNENAKKPQMRSTEGDPLEGLPPAAQPVGSMSEADKWNKLGQVSSAPVPSDEASKAQIHALTSENASLKAALKDVMPQKVRDRGDARTFAERQDSKPSVRGSQIKNEKQGSGRMKPEDPHPDYVGYMRKGVAWLGSQAAKQAAPRSIYSSPDELAVTPEDLPREISAGVEDMSPEEQAQLDKAVAPQYTSEVVEGPDGKRKVRIHTEPQVPSDEKAKKLTNLSSALAKGKEEKFPITEQLVSGPTKLDPISFRYDNNKTGNWADQYGSEPRVGLSANQMELNPITQATVKKDENGMRHVDTGQATMAFGAATTELARRNKELEAQTQANTAALARVLGEKAGSKKKGLDLRTQGQTQSASAEGDPGKEYRDRESEWRKTQAVPTAEKAYKNMYGQTLPADSDIEPVIAEGEDRSAIAAARRKMETEGSPAAIQEFADTVNDYLRLPVAGKERWNAKNLRNEANQAEGALLNEQTRLRSALVNKSQPGTRQRVKDVAGLREAVDEGYQRDVGRARGGQTAEFTPTLTEEEFAARAKKHGAKLTNAEIAAALKRAADRKKRGPEYNL